MRFVLRRVASPRAEPFDDSTHQAHACRVVLTNERSGFHLYLPCPDCLHTHGKQELEDPKYAINVSKYLEQGKFRSDATGRSRHDPLAILDEYERLQTRNERSGICMQTRQAKAPHRFSVQELLAMGTVTQRHPDIRTRAEIRGQAGSADRESFWLPDAATGQTPAPDEGGRQSPHVSHPPGIPFRIPQGGAPVP